MLKLARHTESRGKLIVKIRTIRTCTDYPHAFWEGSRDTIGTCRGFRERSH